MRVGKRLKPSEKDPKGAVVQSRTCAPLLALTLLATLGSATAMADPLTCQGWFDASDNLADKPYTATLMRLIPADMPMEEMDRFLYELALECLKHDQFSFASRAKQVLRGLDGPKQEIENVAPTSQIAEMASKPPDPEIAAPKPQIQEAAPEPQVRETQAKVKGHHNDHGAHMRKVRAARTPKSVASASVHFN